MIWLPVIHDAKVWQYDRVFIDETQDLNQAQIKLALKACKKGGRICAVGDNFQSIYGFTGADTAALDNVVKNLDAKVLPLSVTYRCAKAIVAIAQEFVPDLEAAPDAKEGTVSYIGEKEMLKQVQAGDFILSRTNAPLIGYCLRLIREGKRANIQGRDIGATLASFIKKSKAKTIPTLVKYTEAWREKEIARLLKKIPPADTQSVDDKADTILALAEGVPSIQALLTSIEELFSDDDNTSSKIVLSTTHKAKGLERDRVFLLRDTYMRSRRDQAVAQEEKNLLYVAITRSREHLFMVSTKGGA
jgi:DNA helicase-2/ATP-dependent DNA helicase PcrA